MSISDKYLGFLHLSREYGIYFQESATKIRLLKMPVNLVQYRGAVGNFHNRRFFNTKVVKLFLVIDIGCLQILIQYYFYY